MKTNDQLYVRVFGIDLVTMRNCEHEEVRDANGRPILQCRDVNAWFNLGPAHTAASSLKGHTFDHASLTGPPSKTAQENDGIYSCAAFAPFCGPLLLRGRAEKHLLRFTVAAGGQVGSKSKETERLQAAECKGSCRYGPHVKLPKRDDPQERPCRSDQ